MSFREWAGLAASLAGLAGFLGGIAITQEAIVALGVMGLVYLGVGLAAAAFTLGDALIGGEGVDSERVRSALFTLFVIGVPVAWEATIGDGFRPDLDSFGYPQVVGIFGAGLTLWVAAVLLRDQHRKRFKTCPDCLSHVPTDARVCRWCGFRWSSTPPRLPRRK